MKNHTSIPTPLVVAALGATLGAALLVGPTMAQECLPFQGIDHCPLADTSLDLGPEGLEVIKMGGVTGKPGTAAHLPAGTTFWAAQLAFDPDVGPGPWMLMSAIADGAAVARLRLDEVDNGYLQSVPGVNNGYRVSLGFSGAANASTYTVLAYDDGVLQSAAGGVASDDHLLQTTVPHDDLPNPWDVIIFDWPGPFLPGPDEDGPFPGEDEGPTTTFGIETLSGSCFFSIASGRDMRIQLPGGPVVTADEVRFVEELANPGVYPVFHGMEILLGGDRMTIVNAIANGI